MRPPRASRRVRIESQVRRNSARRQAQQPQPPRPVAGPTEPSPAAAPPVLSAATMTPIPRQQRAAQSLKDLPPTTDPHALPAPQIRVAVLTRKRIVHLIGECAWTQPGMVPHDAIVTINQSRWLQIVQGQVQPTGLQVCTVCAVSPMMITSHASPPAERVPPRHKAELQQAPATSPLPTSTPPEVLMVVANAGPRLPQTPDRHVRTDAMFDWPDTLRRVDVDWLSAHLRLAGVEPPWRSLGP